MLTCEPAVDNRLWIRCEPGRLEQLTTAIDGALNSGWQRDWDQEDKCAPILRPFVTCYRCDASGDRVAGVVGLHRLYDNFLCVTDVSFAGRVGVKVDFSTWEKPTAAQRDRVLFDFHDRVLSKLPPGSCIGFATEWLRRGKQ